MKDEIQFRLACFVGVVLLPIPIVIVVALCGCEPTVESKTVGDLEVVMVGDGSAKAVVQIIKIRGHHLAVACSGGHVAICEVTSRSLWNDN